jgi:2-dehydropantoate 2-reductase
MVSLTNQLKPDDKYDLIIVAMRKSSRLEACKILTSNKYLNSVLFLGNDISGFQKYKEYLPEQCILLGFPGAGGGYKDGDLIMVDKDKPDGKKTPLYIGEVKSEGSKRIYNIKDFLESADLPVSIEKDIDGWLKYHYAFIAPTAGVAFKNKLDLAKAAEDKQGLRKYLKACREAGNVLSAAGYIKRQPPIFNLYYFLPEFLAPKVFKNLFGSRFAEVAIGLHARAIGSEFREMTDEFRELQKSSSISTPYLDELLSYIPNS